MKIGLLLYPSCIPTGLFAGLDFFKAANLILGQSVFDARLVALESSVVCSHNQKLSPQISIEKFNPDAIVIPGFWAESAKDTDAVIIQNKRLQTYLSKLTKEKNIWSYCTGLLFHARTNRLNGKEATATWWLSRHLIQQYPKVHWQFENGFIFSKSDTTASGANGYNSIYEEVLKKLGSKRALADVQKYLMSPPQPELNDPFYSFEMTPMHSPSLAKILKMVQNKPAYQLSLKSVAAELGVSTKTLSRRLKKEVSSTPAQFFRMIKFNQCRKFLISSDLSISEICAKFGFEDESNFSRSFKLSTRMTPAGYRQRFKRI